MESFGAAFPRVFSDPGFKGWFVAILLLGEQIQWNKGLRWESIITFTAAWLGSLVNGPLADKFGRKIDMIVAVAIFLAGSAVQAGAVNIVMLFLGTI